MRREGGYGYRRKDARPQATNIKNAETNDKKEWIHIIKHMYDNHGKIHNAAKRQRNDKEQSTRGLPVGR